MSWKHGSSSLVSTWLCLFCQGLPKRDSVGPKSLRTLFFTHSAAPLSHTPAASLSEFQTRTLWTTSHRKSHTPALRTRSPSSKTRSSRTRCSSLAHGFRLDRLAIVRPIPRRSPAHHWPSRKALYRQLTASEVKSASPVCASSAIVCYAEACARAAYSLHAAMAFRAKTPSFLHLTARGTAFVEREERRGSAIDCDGRTRVDDRPLWFCGRAEQSPGRWTHCFFLSPDVRPLAVNRTMCKPTSTRSRVDAAKTVRVSWTRSGTGRVRVGGVRWERARASVGEWRTTARGPFDVLCVIGLCPASAWLR